MRDHRILVRRPVPSRRSKTPPAAERNIVLHDRRLALLLATISVRGCDMVCAPLRQSIHTADESAPRPPPRAGCANMRRPPRRRCSKRQRHRGACRHNVPDAAQSPSVRSLPSVPCTSQPAAIDGPLQRANLQSLRQFPIAESSGANCPFTNTSWQAAPATGTVSISCAETATRPRRAAEMESAPMRETLVNRQSSSCVVGNPFCKEARQCLLAQLPQPHRVASCRSAISSPIRFKIFFQSVLSLSPSLFSLPLFLA